MIYLLSDAHFGFTDNENEKFEKFKKFLNKVENNAQKLIILGDLFDFWFEYKSAILSRNFKIISEIYRISQKVKIIYIAGNHDLWINGFLKDLGIETVIGTITLEVGGKHIMLAHGDDLKRRIKTRDILLNPFLVKIFSFIHPDIGLKLAKLVSKISRNAHTQQVKEIPEWLWSYFSKCDEDILVVGHLHNPLISKRENKSIICIGDWLYHFTYGIIENNEIKVLNENDEILFKIII